MADKQLPKYKSGHKGVDVLTTGAGCPVGDKTNVVTAGERGPLLLQDLVYLDEIAHFDRERIPERVVHAKGAGAHGYFEVTHDISAYCKASVFSSVGKRTPIFARMSTVGGESGSADTARDPRGFAVKFYTDEGVWDLVGNNTPIFFIRDPLMFPNFIHTQKRNPKTHLKDPTMVWDFFGLRPETTHQMSFLYSDRGTPDGFRHMNGYGSHTFKMVNNHGDAHYVKFHYKTDQGIKCLMADEAGLLAGQNPDYAIQDLFNAIERGDYPSYTLYIQVMTFQQAEKWKFNPFDLTKVWPHKEFPLLPVGKLVFNRNPENYFAEVEQAAFSPSHMPPGIEASPDKMLQGRLFSYPDTHRHRLGANYLQIPINCPMSPVKNYQRDGPACVNKNQGSAPNYYPNSFGGPEQSAKFLEHRFKATSADVARYNSADLDNFSQVKDFWSDVLSEEERSRLVQNISNHLVQADPSVWDRVFSNLSMAHPDYGNRVKTEVNRLYKINKAAKESSSGLLRGSGPGAFWREKERQSKGEE